MTTNNAVNEPTAASGKVLQGQGVGTASAFSTATYPSTATGTGTILRADGTNWSATTATYPNTSGSSGNLLASDGTNFTSQTAAGLGASMRLVSSLTASNSATISFTGLSTFGAVPFLIYFRNVWAATSTAALQMVVSSDNGSTYANSGYRGGVTYNPYNLTTLTNSNSTTFYPLSGPSTANTSIGGWIYISGINNADVTILNGQVCYPDSTLSTRAFGTIGGDCTLTAVNAIRFLMSSGNMTIGTFDLYALRES